MQVTQSLKKTGYWLNYRQECAVYIGKHLKDAIIPITPLVIVQEKEELVFTPPEKEQYSSICNADAEFILEERASILCEDANIPFEWAVAILRLNLRTKPFSMSVKQWDNIKTALDLLCENECEILKTIISHNWGLSDIFSCYKQELKKVYPSMGLLMMLDKQDKIIEVNSHVIKTQNKTGSIKIYSRHYSGYHVQQVLIHDLP